MLEVLHRKRLVHGLSGLGLVLLHQIGPEITDTHVQRVIHRCEVAAEHLHSLIDQVIAHLRLWPRMPVKIGDVVARGLRPVVAVPARVEEDDVAFADLLAFRQAPEHVLERVVGPRLRDRPEVDHESRAEEILDRNLSEVLSRRPVVDGRIDMCAGVHVRFHEHGALTVAVVRRDIGHLDGRELRPRRHPVAPGLREIDELHKISTGSPSPGRAARRPSS